MRVPPSLHRTHGGAHCARGGGPWRLVLNNIETAAVRLELWLLSTAVPVAHSIKPQEAWIHRGLGTADCCWLPVTAAGAMWSCSRWHAKPSWLWPTSPRLRLLHRCRTQHDSSPATANRRCCLTSHDEWKLCFERRENRLVHRRLEPYALIVQRACHAHFSFPWVFSSFYLLTLAVFRCPLIYENAIAGL